ncbi:MAG: PEFG-CTERM sorting domain-containing protein [Thaumarchaeota archaeon]|nr:MAG: PEFG-CTERM sorting domain-containing protein [Nitrososphaerota archaeon]
MSTHREYALIAILATIAVVGVVPAFADCPPDCNPKANYNPLAASGPILPISVSTDKPTYDHKSTIIVSGHVDHAYPGADVGLKVTSPSGNVVSIAQLTPDTNGDYTTKLNTASPVWTENGAYTIYVQLGEQQGRTNSVLIQLTGEIPGQPPAIPEFGPIAALVLAIAIISIIVVSAKTGLRFMPKY